MLDSKIIRNRWGGNLRCQGALAGKGVQNFLYAIGCRVVHNDHGLDWMICRMTGMHASAMISWPFCEGWQ